MVPPMLQGESAAEAAVNSGVSKFAESGGTVGRNHPELGKHATPKQGLRNRVNGGAKGSQFGGGIGSH